MRYSRKSEVVLSEDQNTTPEQVRFSSKNEDVDLTTLKDGVGGSKTYPSGTHNIDMAQITQGLWLYIKPDKDITLSIDGGAPIVFKEGKASEMWIEFTALQIVTVEATRISLGLAGE